MAALAHVLEDFMLLRDSARDGMAAAMAQMARPCISRGRILPTPSSASRPCCGACGDGARRRTAGVLLEAGPELKLFTAARVLAQEVGGCSSSIRSTVQRLMDKYKPAETLADVREITIIK
jgi:hypothetical protein